jgi:hypothetical protein
MPKPKIRIELEDETGRTKSIERELDIDGIDTYDEMELEILKASESGTTFLMNESLKKNKKIWWKRLWWKIRSWFATVKKVFRLKAR